MAKTDLPLTDTIKKNPEVLFQIRQALGILYDENGKLVPGNEAEAQNLLKEIHSPEIGIPDDYSIKEIGIQIEKWYEAVTQTQAPEYEAPTVTQVQETPAANTVGKGRLGEMEEAEEKKSAQYKKDVQENKDEIQAALDKKIENAGKAREALAKKEAFVKIQEQAKLSEKQKEQFEVMQAQVNANPTEAEKLFEKDIKSRVSPDTPDKVIALTAAGIVANIQTDYGKSAEAAVTKDLSNNPEHSWASPLSEMQDAQFELKKKIATQAYGELGEKIFPSKATVVDTPQDGTITVPLGPMPLLGISLLNTQKEIVNNPNQKIDSFLEDPLKKQLDDIKARGTQGNYQTTVLMRSLSYFPRGTQTVWGQSDNELLVRAAGIPKGSGVADFLAREGAKKLVGKAVGNLAVKGGLVAAEELAAGPSLGLSLLLAGATNFIVDKFSALQTWLKEHNLDVAVPALLVGLPIGMAFGFTAGLLTTGGVFGLGSFLNSSAAAKASFGSTVGSFFGAVFHATLGAIGMPILFILLGFPTIVALILFIINSGAYVVPPGGGFSGSLAACNTDQIGGQTSQTGTDPAVNAAMCIFHFLGKNGINPLLASNDNGSAWKNFVADLAKPSASDVLHLSASSQGGLQCSGYVGAVANAAFGVNFPVTNACLYSSGMAKDAGYKYVSGSSGIKVGDFFVIGSKTCSDCGKKNADVGSCGHIGVVCGLAGVKITACDANAKVLGLVRGDGIIATSQISGYLHR